MRTIRRTFLVIALGAVVLGLSPTRVTATGHTSSATSTPIQAVVILLKVYYSPLPPHVGPCFPLLSHPLTGCPITPRLVYRVQHPPQYERADPICRCQNFPQSLQWVQVDNNGYVSHVNTHWNWPGLTQRITFVVARQAAGWQVDDAYCTGSPLSSIYTIPVRPC